jgi:hypothetical protein
LADLGIEFGPARNASHNDAGGPSPSSRKTPPPPEKSRLQSDRGPSTGSGPKTFSLNEIMQKGENVPFNKNRKDKKERKSVDIEDLRKTLDQALQKPEEEKP